MGSLHFGTQHENGDLQKIKGGLNLLKAGHPTLRHQLKRLCHAILGNFGTDQLVIKLTEI